MSPINEESTLIAGADPQPSNGRHPSTDAKTEEFVEMLERERFTDLLSKVASENGILPKSHYLIDTTLDPSSFHSGKFTDIYQGQRGERQVRIKVFRTMTPEYLDKIKRRFYCEIVWWRSICDPNLVPFLGVSESLFPFCVISLWQPGGDIRKYVDKNRSVNRLQLLAQAVCGLKRLHSSHLVHGGVNPGNILIDGDGNARLDLGTTGVLTDPTVMEPGSAVPKELVSYMAPELLRSSGSWRSDSKPTKKSDIYSFAMTAYEVLTGNPPYGNTSEGDIISHIVSGRRPSRPEDTELLPDNIWYMIQACWDGWQGTRWEIVDILDQLPPATELFWESDDSETVDTIGEAD